ncbi:MAG: hypothetical protein HYT93_00155 [Parcubacteria group bacterium]|nr:hypothetical protein [Parcubacteria group bacterium]
MNIINRLYAEKVMNAPFAFFVIVLLLAVAFLIFKTDMLSDIRAVALLNNCKIIKDNDKKIDCLYTIMENETLRDGPRAGLRIVSAAYVSDFFKKAIFYEDGCHRLMHSLGDFTYYNLYLNTKDISLIDFSPSMLACGYGFSHAVVGHLVQDNASSKFVTEICENVKTRYNNKIRSIGNICYLGAGHGLLYSNIEQTPRSKWGNLNVFVEKPVEQCEALLLANEDEKEACKTGVLGAMLRFIQEDSDGHGNKNGYDISLSAEDPFSICEGLKINAYATCNKIMAHSLYTMYTLSDKNTFPVINKIQSIEGDWQFKKVMLYNVLNNVIYLEHEKESQYQRILAQCEFFEQEVYEGCVKGIVHALYEFGIPGKTYKHPIVFCSNPTLEEKGLRNFCYGEVIKKIPILFEPEDIGKICKQFPKDIRNECGKLTQLP